MFIVIAFYYSRPRHSFTQTYYTTMNGLTNIMIDKSTYNNVSHFGK